MRIEAVLVVGLLAVLVGGVAVWSFMAVSPEPAPEVSGDDPAGEEKPEVDPVAKETDRSEAERRLRAQLDRAEKELAAIRRVAGAQRSEIADLKERLQPFLEREGISVDAVMALIGELKGQGISAFLQPGKLSKLVSDLRALGSEGVQAVIGMLGSEDENERFLAAKLLEDLGDPAAAQDLAKVALEDPSELVAGMASHALALMGDPGLTDLLRKIKDQTERTNVRLNTMFGLMTVGEQKALDESLAFFKDPKTPDVLKRAMGQGVLLMDKPHVKPVVDLIHSLDRKSVDLGRAVVDFYKRVGTVECRGSLQDIANDPELPAALREYALEALK